MIDVIKLNFLELFSSGWPQDQGFAEVPMEH